MASMPSQSNPKSLMPPDPLDLFRHLSETYAQFAAEENVKVRPYLSPDLPLYSKLSREEQELAVNFLQEAVQIFSEMQQEGISLRNDLQLLWRSLSRLRMIPEKDIFDKITDGFTIEVYAMNHRHLFWNLNMMEVLSLTLEQLLCKPWWELASRPQEITNAFMEIIGKMISGETPGTIPIQVPVHILEEIDSELSYRIEVDVKYISPLKRDGKMVGGITVARAKVVGSNLNSATETQYN
jgi:hypothetical protein